MNRYPLEEAPTEQFPTVDPLAAAYEHAGSHLAYGEIDAVSASVSPEDIASVAHREGLHRATTDGVLQALSVKMQTADWEHGKWSNLVSGQTPYTPRQGDSMKMMFLHDPVTHRFAIAEAGLNEHQQGEFRISSSRTTPDSDGEASFGGGLNMGFDAATGIPKGAYPDDPAKLAAIQTAISRSVPVDPETFYKAEAYYNSEEGQKKLGIFDREAKRRRAEVAGMLSKAAVTHAAELQR